MTYLIWAAEDTYRGLHGIFNVDVIETDSEQWVREMAEEMSYDIINEYNEFQEAIEEEVRELAEVDNLNEEEIDEAREDIIKERLYYNWWKLSNEYTCDEYRKMLERNDWEEIRDKYGCTGN